MVGLILINIVSIFQNDESSATYAALNNTDDSMSNISLELNEKKTAEAVELLKVSHVFD